jgi:hypothetical protein
MPVASSSSEPSEAAAPVGDYLREIDALLAAHDCLALDRIGPAVGAGRASRDVVRRVALEHYCVEKWTMPELAVLIANAPDVYRFTMEHSTHYRHWGRTFAEQTGYLGHSNQVQAALEWCRQLGISDDDVRAYTPLPQTIAMACTMVFYVRRSYEEGIAAFAYAAERIGAGAGHARRLADALRAHYGVTGPDVGPGGDAVHDATVLFAAVAVTRPVQQRCREAIRNVALTAECRVRAMNRWVE